MVRVLPLPTVDDSARTPSGKHEKVMCTTSNFDTWSTLFMLLPLHVPFEPFEVDAVFFVSKRCLWISVKRTLKREFCDHIFFMLQ